MLSPLVPVPFHSRWLRIHCLRFRDQSVLVVPLAAWWSRHASSNSTSRWTAHRSLSRAQIWVLVRSSSLSFAGAEVLRFLPDLADGEAGGGGFKGGVLFFVFIFIFVVHFSGTAFPYVSR